MFLKAISLCHTVHISDLEETNRPTLRHVAADVSKVQYYAASPDEIALVEAARR